MKKFWIVIVISLSFIFVVSCSQSTNETKSSNLLETTSPTSEDYGFITVQINPAFDLMVDQNNRVVSVLWLNEDAEILGAGLELVGSLYSDALVLILEAALETGYIDPLSSTEVIRFDALNSQASEGESWREDVESVLEDFLVEKNLEMALISFEELPNDEVNVVSDHTESIAHAMMILHLMEISEFSIDELLSLTVEELMEETLTRQSEQMTIYQEQFETERAQVKESLVETTLNEIIRQYQTENNQVSEPTPRNILNAEFMDNHQSLILEYETKTKERIENTIDIVAGVRPRHLVGEYIFEISDLPMPYTVLYEYYQLHDDGSYTHAYSWTISNQTSTGGPYQGTWEVIDGSLVLTNDNGYETIFEMAVNRLILNIETGYKTGIYRAQYYRKVS